MKRAFVVIGEGESRRRVAVDTSLVVGRSPNCGLVIDDAAASRRHLEIQATAEGFSCHDLGSRNGTLVNGVRVSGCELRPGDRIGIGQTVLRFEVAEDEVRSTPERTVFPQTLLDSTGRVQSPSGGGASRSKELLEAAYTVMNALASNFDQCELVDCILRTTLGAMHGQRGAVLFAGVDGELLPCAACGAVHTIQDGVSHPARIDDIEISGSVARRVLREGQNVLFQSARGPAPASQSESISKLKLTSILCVPIRTQQDILGILYIDTDVASHAYNEDDLLLAAAAGNSAGLALENARIHKDLLDKQRLEHDIAAAWTIQEGFLVKDWPEEDSRFQVYGVTHPARVVGGDFYDFVRLGPDTVGLLIGDVSGKGVPAALTMAQLLAEFRLCSRTAASPSEVLSLLSERLVRRSRRGTFCTMVYLVVDLAAETITGANAGHPPVVRVSSGGAQRELEPSGPPCGILTGAQWRDETLPLRSGDSLLLYTDGIMEAREPGPQDEAASPPAEYGIERLLEVAATQAGRPPQELVDSVLADVRSYCRPLPPHDDCTMIAFTYRGQKL